MGSQLAKQDGLCHGFVIMPNHVHAVISFHLPEQLGYFMKQWKQRSSVKIKKCLFEYGKNYVSWDYSEPIWQGKYYDFNIFSIKKSNEKLEYMHNNPVRAGLVEYPEDWLYSSCRWYMLGKSVGVSIHSID
jgi:putative transposase